MSESVKVTVIGADGRMGRLIVQAIHEAGGIELIGAVEANKAVTCNPVPGSEGRVFFTSSCSLNDDNGVKKFFHESDVFIDVSSPEGIQNRIRLAEVVVKPLVIGTTGLSDDDRVYLKKSAKLIPIVLAPNFSVGANSMFKLVDEMVNILGPEYQVEIIETHHEMKRDAPSGTAKRLAEVVADARGQRLIDVACYGRSGMRDCRPEDEIGIHSLRVADVVGEHTITFFGRGERVELTHRVTSRVAFAEGAVRAAKWIVRQKPGLYDMQDVLGLR